MARTRYIIKTKGKFKLGKPFPYEDELNEKLARLTELNALLNIDDKAIENVSIVLDRMAADQILDISTWYKSNNYFSSFFSPV